VLSREDFKPATLGDYALFKKHYHEYPQVHSDNTFANMVCWNHYANYSYAYLNGSVILASTIEGRTRYRTPIGPPDATLFLDVCRLALESGDDQPLVLIDSLKREWVKHAFPDLPLVPAREYYEYVYRATDLANLEGKKYFNIRRQVNKFRKRCPYTSEPLDDGNIDEVREFLSRWCEWKGCDEDSLLAHERDAVFFGIDHYREIGLSGLVIRVKGVVSAISLFERLNVTTAVVHFEKGLSDCPGIYKAVNAETAALLAPRFTYVNRESDMGIPGLREAKVRYHPHHLVEAYRIRHGDLETFCNRGGIERRDEA
jgi:hypothetical protein